MRNPIAGYLGFALFASLALTGVSRAQSQTTPAQPQSQQNPDSPADAAAKSKAAKSNTAPKKVYTNDDLTGSPSQMSVAGSKNGDAKASKSTAASSEPKNEQSWRGRAQTLRNQMADVDRQIAQLTAANQTNSSGSAGSNPSSPAPLSAYTNASHAGAGNRLEKLRNRKAELQSQMDQLEEEARRAGVPPGWLR
jgi:hypothetical protein